jgi:hypothetical protein
MDEYDWDKSLLALKRDIQETASISHGLAKHGNMVSSEI